MSEDDLINWSFETLKVVLIVDPNIKKSFLTNLKSFYLYIILLSTNTLTSFKDVLPLLLSFPMIDLLSSHFNLKLFPDVSTASPLLQMTSNSSFTKVNLCLNPFKFIIFLC